MTAVNHSVLVIARDQLCEQSAYNTICSDYPELGFHSNHIAYEVTYLPDHQV